MTCISYHPYAFYNESGKVVNVASFGGHDENLVAEIAVANNYHGWVSSCEYGPIAMGDTWDGEKVIKKEPETVSMSFPKEWLDDDPELANIPGATFY